MPRHCGGNTVNLDPLDVAVCTFTNADQPAQLTLVKTVDQRQRRHRGAAATGRCPRPGRPRSPGAGHSPAVTDQPVNAGTYVLSETGPGRLHRRRPGSCTGGTLTGATVTVPPGGDVTCTITNNDQPAQLTLVKAVVNDNGGTAVPADWTLSRRRPDRRSPARRQQPGRDRPDRERRRPTTCPRPGPAGYTASAWICVGGTLDRRHGHRPARRRRHLHHHQQRPAGPADPGQDGHQRQRRHRGAGATGRCPRPARPRSRVRATARP